MAKDHTVTALNLNEPDVLEELWALQHLAYRVEAKRIGFAQIPPLMDTMESLRRCGETFYGVYADDELAGAISWQREGDSAVICRLMVHPDHFRRGFGRKLLSYVIAIANSSTYRVSTGEANEPAVRLYTSEGFAETGRTEIAEGVFLTHFSRKLHI